MNGNFCYLIVESNSSNSHQHATDVPQSDRILEHEQRDTDDNDPLCGICHGIADRRDSRYHAEGHNVLSEGKEAV